MIPFLVTGIAVFAFSIIIFFMLIIDKFEYIRTWIAICVASFISGIVLISMGFNMHAQNVSDNFLNESETTQIAGLTYYMHEINPDNQDQLRLAREIIKYTNSRVLFYNQNTHHVYELINNELQPYYINEHETIYQNGKIITK